MASEAEKLDETRGTEGTEEVEFEEVELEFSDDDILYYLVDEDEVEVGFVIEEDGQEVECYYEEFAEMAFEVIDEDEKSSGSKDAKGTAQASAQAKARPQAKSAKDETPENPSYLYKMATIAGHEGNKARKKAEKALDGVREKTTEQAKKAKAKADELDLGITRDDVSQMTSDLNEIAREGAATAKELKETYDDIMDSFGFLMPKGKRRR